MDGSSLSRILRPMAIAVVIFLVEWLGPSVLDEIGMPFGYRAALLASSVLILAALFLWYVIAPKTRWYVHRRAYDWRQTQPMTSTIFFGLIGFVVFASLWQFVTLRSPREDEPKSQAELSAADIATEVVERGRVRNLFQRELDRPVTSMHVIATLQREVNVAELRDVAIVVSVADTVEKERDSVFFGVRFDTEDMHEIVNGVDRAYSIDRLRARMWLCPRSVTPDAQPVAIDDFGLFSLDGFNNPENYTLIVDRLEAGAIVNTPFESVQDLDHAAVNLSATRQLLESLEWITLVVNEFVVFEIDKADIVGWSPPFPPMVGRIEYIDPSAGTRKVVKEQPLSMNFTMVDDFKPFEFFSARFDARVAPEPPPLNMNATISLTDTQVRIHRVLGSAHQAKLGGSLGVLPDRRGWLPKESIRPPVTPISQ